jgi:putative FmdB family regulatory protein
MPTYEYRCRDCGHSFDIVQKMSDEPLTHCPECGGTLRKVFAPPAISFKGSGFYATDHGKKAKSSSSDGASKDTDSKDATDTTKKDSSDTTKKDTKGSDSSSSSSGTTTKKEGSS